MTTIRSRTALFLFALAVLAAAGQLVFAQAPPAAKSLYTLEPDEEILRPESTIALSAEADDVILVLSKGGAQTPPYFVFRDGRKTGPYAKLEEAMKAAYEGRPSPQRKQHECAAYEPGEPPDEARPMTGSAAGGKQVVNFKGKELGSHLLVFAAKATPDGATAYYVAGDNDKATFGCSDGRVVTFGGIPEDFKFSPDGRNAAALVQGKLSLAEMNNLSQLPPDKIAAVMKDQENKYLYTIDGRSFGPFGGSFASHSFWYPGSSNDLYYRVGNDVFRNGAILFKAAAFDRCNFYPSPDGKTYAIYSYERIAFSDGQAFPSPLDVAVFPREGKTVFRWITLENEKKLVVYERSL
jgi:hypothetical protein